MQKSVTLEFSDFLQSFYDSTLESLHKSIHPELLQNVLRQQEKLQKVRILFKKKSVLFNRFTKSIWSMLQINYNEYFVNYLWFLET